MIFGQVAVMRLLSALFFICCKTAAVESARLSGTQPVRRTVPGDWGMPTNKRSPFCTKGHCLPILENH